VKQRTLSDPDYLHLIAALRRRREELGLSQLEVATALGKAQSYVGKYETCERRLDIIEVLRVCRVLRIRLGEALPNALRGDL
jgi:transcriptional regulator with XRE-family HTH domain